MNKEINEKSCKNQIVFIIQVNKGLSVFFLRDWTIHMDCPYYSKKLNILQMVTLIFTSDAHPTTVALVNLELKLGNFWSHEV